MQKGKSNQRKKLFVLGIALSLCITVAIGQSSDKEKSIPANDYVILTPKPGSEPAINGPLVYGGRPGHPFVYRIPCQGIRPMKFSVDGLPTELTLNPLTGIITGTTPAKGEYNVVIKATNKAGRDKRKFKIVSGDKLALTPPMGWNTWNAYHDNVTDKLVRENVEAMINSGMADAGYTYVNIDDCWMNTTDTNFRLKDSLRAGPFRNKEGNILANHYFPDMKGLTNYIHSKGLKAGIYTSPGPLTCMLYAGSYQHEEQDALQFTKWGFDFLKYDMCSYARLPGVGKTVEAYQKPFRQMGEILKSLDRDVVFNLCQYGLGDVWKWGAEVGGNSWRTAYDLGGRLGKIFDIAIRNAELRDYSKPGAWNDPDYLIIGWYARSTKSGPAEYTKMLPATQYAYMSLWCLMASPLIYSGDMTKLDDFTLNILTNREVIDIDQDPLGESGRAIRRADSSLFLMVKNLSDGSKAVGLFNRGKEAVEITADWIELGIEGIQTVRDLWRQKNLGKYKQSFTASVPAQGAVMVKITPN